MSIQTIWQPPALNGLNLPSRPWLLVALVLLCLVPRVVMALRLPSVCPDGVVYIRAAQSIEAGNLRLGFTNMSLNVYPLILLLLHRTGMDWESAAAVWGVLISSLVVLPLWGWVRRQFDDSVALTACLLYAVHPKLIEWSPEAMRDPTFWFLFMLAIYWLWRAITGVSYRYFLAAGAAVTLASLTRHRGPVPADPVGAMDLLAVPGIGGRAAKLLLGGALCLAVFPALLLLVNVGWVCGHAGWTSLRTAPLLRRAAVAPARHGICPRRDRRRRGGRIAHFGRMMWVFFPTMTRGLSPIFALLMFGGIWGWRKAWSRRDHQPLFLTGMVIVLGIWIQLWYDKIICPRYALPIVLMGARSPHWAGWGLRRGCCGLPSTSRNGDKRLPERPFGCFAQKGPVPTSVHRRSSLPRRCSPGRRASPTP